MLLGTLGASLLNNLLAGKGIIRQGKEQLSLTENEPKFNGVYSRNNLSKIRDRAYKIYLDEYDSIGTHWIALYSYTKNVTYFDCFGVEHIRNKKIHRE